MELHLPYLRTFGSPHHQFRAALRPAIVLVVVALAGLTATPPRSFAQMPAQSATPSSSAPSVVNPLNVGSMNSRAGATINVKVMDRETKNLLKQQSVVRLTRQSTGQVFFQTTRASETKFTDLPAGTYLIEVGSSGYLGMHQEITISDAAFDVSQTVSLSRDPAAVDFKLKNPGEIPSNARKEAQKGIQALEFSNFQEAQKYLEAANRKYPSSSSINFLLGYLALQQKDPDRELAFLTTATKLDPGNVQAQNLLGQLYYERGDYARAAQAEEIVIATSTESVGARKILANSYLKLGEFEKARQNSQWLVDKGGKEAASARLVLGQALAGLHQDEAAVQTLKVYLDETPASSVAPQIRNLIAELEKQLSQPGADAKVSLGVSDPALTADKEFFSANSAGMPYDIDAQKPSLAAGIPCPASILEATANPSKQLVDSITQFSAIEHMVHESISPQGIPRSRETRQYNYVVAITQPAVGPLQVQEYLDAGNLEVPDKIKSNGLALLAIAFHPFFRNDFAMQCEGLGDWDGQATWLVHFRQVDDKPSRLRSYVVAGNIYPVPLKGRAWIRADNLQILHLETDLVRPIPEIQLMTEHTSISYGPVQFKRGASDLWLPMNAELYVHFGKRRFHRVESFDHFMLFATDAVEKPKIPKGNPVSDSTSNPGPAANQ